MVQRGDEERGLGANAASKIMLSLLTVKIVYPPHLSLFFFSFLPILLCNLFSSIPGLETCHRGYRDQYLPSLNHRIIRLSGRLTEALIFDINLGLSYSFSEGQTFIQTLLYT